MKAQGQGGKLMYAAPEVIGKKEVVDAFAIDLWSAGVVLFVMLVGLAPFKWAHPTDKRYSKISKGGLKDLMDTLDIPLSPEASDLLQGFFWADPRRRLTLAEVMEHPWVQGKRFVDISLRPSNSPKKFTFNHLDNNKAKTTGPKSCENLKRTRFRSCGPRLVTPHL
jgi:serine/threonine protein kinase